MGLTKMKTTTRWLVALLLPFMVSNAHASWSSVNMPKGVTAISHDVYNLHMIILIVCCLIGLVVFGAIFYSIINHRKSKGYKAAQFHESTTVEIIWTVIPFIILIGMAIPATKTLIAMEDTSDADMTVQITAYQWKWHYNYLDHGVNFYSTLATPRSEIYNKTAKSEDYLLQVDNEVVLPINKKVRILLTSNDVNHAWWIPDLAVKKDAIPGFINQMWTKIDKPGVYRGQCAELCGRDHGFMPIVVRAVEQAEFDKWVAANNGGAMPASASTTTLASDTPQTATATLASAAETVMKQASDAAGSVATAASIATDNAVTAAGATAATITDNAKQMMSSTTEAVKAPVAAVTSGADMKAIMTKGDELYRIHCLSCHMANGEGIPNVFPAIKGSAIATGDVNAHIDMVLNGKTGTAMRAFGPQFSDADIAAIVTFERNAWGNNTGDLVTADQVKGLR